MGRGSWDPDLFAEEGMIHASSYAAPPSGDGSLRPKLTRVDLLSAALDHSAVPIFILDGNRKHVEANHTGCKVLDTTKTHLISLRLDDLTPDGATIHCKDLFPQLLKDGSVTSPYQIESPSGKELNIELTIKANVVPGFHLSTWTSVEEAKSLDDIPEDQRLSDREREIMTLIAAGENYQSIAKKLFLSSETVRSYSRTARLKLGAKSREHAVILAASSGQIDVKNL